MVEILPWAADLVPAASKPAVAPASEPGGRAISRSLDLTQTGREMEVVVMEQASNRMSIREIARRLDIGRVAVYQMLDEGLLPGIRLGRRWIVTRHAYEQWEKTCGLPAPQETRKAA